MRTFILLICTTLLSACAGVIPTLDKESGLQEVVIFDNSLIGPNTKYVEYSQCDPEPYDKVSGVQVVHKFGKNCTPKDHAHASSAGMFPSLAGAGSTIAAGALIGNGLSDSGVGGNATSTTVINNSCKGNCGGKRR